MSDLPDFIAQLPAGFIGMVCLPFILLSVYLMYAGYVRPMRRMRKALEAERNMKATNQTAQADNMATAQAKQGGQEDDALALLRSARAETGDDAAPAYSEADLPDLDLLVSEPPAKPVPAPVAPARPVPKGVYRVMLHTGHERQVREVLSVLRDETDGRLMIQIDKTAYRTLVNTPEQKQTFKRIMKELSGVILTPDEMTPDMMTNVAAPVARPAGEYADDESDELHMLRREAVYEDDHTDDETDDRMAQPVAEAPKPQRKAPPPPPQPDGKMPGDLPSYRFDDNPVHIENKRFGGQKIDFEAPPEMDIATAIETYLQYKIQYSPEFRGRNIHVRPSLDGGVRIQVDETYYESVDEIKDPDARAFVREAIAEWQERQ